MGAARGIAGSTVPEADGVFLCQEFMVGFFVGMNNTGGAVDVWAVSGIDEEQLLDNGSGFLYFPDRISAGQIAWSNRSRPTRSAGAHGKRATTQFGDLSARLSASD